MEEKNEQETNAKSSIKEAESNSNEGNKSGAASSIEQQNAASERMEKAAADLKSERLLRAEADAVKRLGGGTEGGAASVKEDKAKQEADKIVQAFN